MIFIILASLGLNLQQDLTIRIRPTNAVETIESRPRPTTPVEVIQPSLANNISLIQTRCRGHRPKPQERGSTKIS